MSKHLLFAAAAALLGSLCVAAPYGGGDGTPVNPYQIWTPQHLNSMASNMLDLDKTFILMADLDMSGYTGTSFNIINSFNGRFLGNHHTIRNLSYATPSEKDNVGLFGSAWRACICDLRLENVWIHTQGISAGGLVGYCMDCEISNCTVTGSVNATTAAGGIVGMAIGGSIISCNSSCNVSGNGGVGGVVGVLQQSAAACDSQASGTVSGTDAVGGFVGGLLAGSLQRCHAAGPVTGTGMYVGGLVGEGEGLVASCRASGTVSGNSIVGGLVGFNKGTISASFATGSVSSPQMLGGLVGLNNSQVADCYASGAVLGSYTSMAGGLIGNCQSGQVQNCYSRGMVSPGNASGGLIGMTNIPFTACFWDIESSQHTNAVGAGNSDGKLGRTTQQMKTLTSFTNAGWNFFDLWAICEGTNYPRLKWQILSADRVCPDGVAMEDLAHFARRWMMTNCALPGACSGADLNFSSAVDLADLMILSDQWLQH